MRGIEKKRCDKSGIMARELPSIGYVDVDSKSLRGRSGIKQKCHGDIDRLKRGISEISLYQLQWYCTYACPRSTLHTSTLIKTKPEVADTCSPSDI